MLSDGDFLIAHFASKFILHDLLIELRENKRTVKEICADDFEQIKVIGKGGFSRVVLARKKDSGRLYALKIMKKSRVF